MRVFRTFLKIPSFVFSDFLHGARGPSTLQVGLSGFSRKNLIQHIWAKKGPKMKFLSRELFILSLVFSDFLHEGRGPSNSQFGRSGFSRKSLILPKIGIVTFRLARTCPTFCILQRDKNATLFLRFEMAASYLINFWNRFLRQKGHRSLFCKIYIIHFSLLC